MSHIDISPASPGLQQNSAQPKAASEAPEPLWRAVVHAHRGGNLKPAQRWDGTGGAVYDGMMGMNLGPDFGPVSGFFFISKQPGYYRVVGTVKQSSSSSHDWEWHPSYCHLWYHGIMVYQGDVLGMVYGIAVAYISKPAPIFHQRMTMTFLLARSKLKTLGSLPAA